MNFQKILANSSGSIPEGNTPMTFFDETSNNQFRDSIIKKIISSIHPSIRIYYGMVERRGKISKELVIDGLIGIENTNGIMFPIEVLSNTEWNNVPINEPINIINFTLKVNVEVSCMVASYFQKRFGYGTIDDCILIYKGTEEAHDRVGFGCSYVVPMQFYEKFKELGLIVNGTTDDHRGF